MNILLLNWRDPKNPKAGGAEYVTHRHACSWAAQGHPVTWFTSAFAGAAGEEMLDGVKIIRRGNQFTVFFFALLYYAGHHKKTDIIVDQVHGIPFFSVLYARKPVILFIHEIAGDIWPVMYPWYISSAGRFVEKLYLKMYKTSTVWTDARSMIRELVAAGMDKSHCIAIPCPISRTPIRQAPHKENNLTVIHVGRIVRMKRIEHVLRAFSVILQKYPKARLRIVGDGDRKYMHELRSLSRNLEVEGHVTWYGRVDEDKKYTLMASSHILLHASVREGWGLVVLEAASRWTPSVAYGVTGLVDVVRDGDTGLIVQGGTSADLGQAVVRLYADAKRYRTMQKQAAQWSGKFRWEQAEKQSMVLLSGVYKQSHMQIQ